MDERRLLHDSPAGHLLVGLFVLLAVVGFGWLLVSQRQAPDAYTLVAEFDSLGNISEATKVKLRGFTIGKVDHIEFRPLPLPGEAHFLVDLRIEEKYPVPQGTVADIRGSGLVGEAFIHLDVSAVEPGMLEPGSHIKGRPDPGMKSMMDKIGDAARRLGEAGGSIKSADLGGKLGRVGEDVARIAVDLGRVAASADSLLTSTRSVVIGIEPDLRRTVQRLDEGMACLTLTLSRTDTAVAAMSQDVQRSARAMRLTVERLERLLQRIDTLVVTKEAELDSTLTNLNATSAAVRQIAEHPWKLLTGQGEAVEEAQDVP